MKTSAIAYIGWLLVGVISLFYTYGIIEAIRISWGAGPIAREYSEVLSAMVGSIQALLLANLGALLGISIADPSSNVARQLMLNRPTQQKANLNPPTASGVQEKVQLVAMVMYVISLIACLVTWIMEDFSSESENVVSVISNSGKMFIGVALAYVTAVLR
ncbi:hypothetical protein [Dyadobacter jiangsuensis]|uniref:Uncharacterized protein n=1 Tax=Dyadobacter jiangsuensis TaxID=1591085 RepID=A0A2P8G0P6_9BACT|nr:hypothetical protein [Dyadobacter jiangsuensis]PSL27465.1 hypothetical protein CLV60_108323 [Dyadobacter jiangsuensis]